jgi:hypothetical protein
MYTVYSRLTNTEETHNRPSHSRLIQIYERNRILICGLDKSGSTQEPMTGFSEQGNERSNSIKCEALPDWMSSQWLLTKNFTAFSKVR